MYYNFRYQNKFLENIKLIRRAWSSLASFAVMVIQKLTMATKYDNMEEKISFFKSSVKSLSSFVC